MRLVAGGVVAASTFASIWWRPARFLAGALGLGLAVAAVTDSCALGNLLARLPYNRRGDDVCDLASVVSTITALDEPTTSELVDR